MKGIDMKDKVISILDVCGFKWITPFIRIASGEDPKEQMRKVASSVGIPLVAFLIFLGMWSVTASNINTSLGKLPGPVAVWTQLQNLTAEYFQERGKEKEFHKRQVERNAKILAEDPAAEVKIRKYTGKPTYLDLHEPCDGVHWLFYRLSRCSSFGCDLRFEPYRHDRVKSFYPSVQAHFSTSVAAFGHSGCERAVYKTQRHVSQGIFDFRDHGFSVLLMADAD
jgi:hypothetical protein